MWLAVARHAPAFPPDVHTVPYGSPEAVAALEAADIVVANTHTNIEWSKGPGTLYLQTWHGTPLKTDRPRHPLEPARRLLDDQQRDVDRWDVLVSPNRVQHAALCRRPSAYEGEVLETGYPRNDVLSAADRASARARARGARHPRRHDRGALRADLARRRCSTSGRSIARPRRRRGSPARSATITCCCCACTTWSPRRSARRRGTVLRDVSAHPDMSELYLAADVLVTDYSSTMFDFAVTGRPMVFLTYDLDRLPRRVRGFYFELADEAPGPLVETTSALIDVLRDLDAARSSYAGRYARFRERYCHLEDGRSTQRVLERLAQVRA